MEKLLLSFLPVAAVACKSSRLRETKAKGGKVSFHLTSVSKCIDWDALASIKVYLQDNSRTFLRRTEGVSHMHQTNFILLTLKNFPVYIFMAS